MSQENELKATFDWLTEVMQGAKRVVLLFANAMDARSAQENELKAKFDWLQSTADPF